MIIVLNAVAVSYPFAFAVLTVTTVVSVIVFILGREEQSIVMFFPSKVKLESMAVWCLALTQFTIISK